MMSTYTMQMHKMPITGIKFHCLHAWDAYFYYIGMPTLILKRGRISYLHEELTFRTTLIGFQDDFPADKLEQFRQ